jgi:predicted GNAT family N-acyltransferase
VVRVSVVANEKDLAESYAVRRNVFVEEQGVAPELEYDGLDAAAKHVIARVDDQVIGTARLVVEGDVGRVGRMAVLKTYRGQGVGGALLNALLALAREQKLAGVYVHAQIQAVDFYGRFGFVAEGAQFDEAGIPHVKMTIPTALLGEAQT